jgi:hypothetical protein
MLSIIYCHDVADHVGHHDAISQVRLYRGGLLPSNTILLGLFAFQIESGVLVLEFSCESSSLSSSEHLDDLLLGQLVDLLGGETSE